MAGTYSGDPSSSAKDMVRFLIGDTKAVGVPPSFLVSDEEIVAVISAGGSTEEGAAMCCETISAYYGRIADQSIGSVSINFSKTATHYLDLAVRLRSGALVVPTNVYCGGISLAEKTRIEENTDRTGGAGSTDARTTLRDQREDI